ncbi:Bifunctional inhibitor/plant lipid transfer protein/seed storage helical domain [Sesbania bispinosa]|nr:Bifunctional inhibitor/plant lipid transfer protein/seed storage helical domain [Sesbania bispinosa]
MDGCMRLMILGLTTAIISISCLVDAQALPPCANQLTPCIDYFNSTNPPNVCCNPIKDIYATQKSCFCQIAFAPGVLQAYGISTAQSLRLLHSCDVNFDLASCKASSALPPSSVQPPATRGSDEGGAGKVTYTGLSFILALWAFVMFH